MMNYTTNRYREHNYKTATTYGEAMELRPHQETTPGAKIFADLQRETFMKKFFNQVEKNKEER